jgi:predicted GNAT family acetyltransferase
MKPSIATPEETDAREGMRDATTQHRGRSVTELTSTFTPCEIAGQAAAAIHALNEVTHGGELTSAADVQLIVASLEAIGNGLPQLCEQLARFLVIQHEDGQVTQLDGQDTGVCVTDIVEALAAAGQAADMMTAALTEARAASASLAAPRSTPV